MTQAVESPGSRYVYRPAITSRLIAQMKADSSRAIAVAMTFGRLPFRVSDRKRPHNLICAFQAISRTACGEAATFICFLRLTRDRNGIAQLRRIDSNERAIMMIHDSPSLLEALPGRSG